MAELADALDSKSSDRKVVGVQVPPPVLFHSKDLGKFGPKNSSINKLPDFMIFGWAVFHSSNRRETGFV